MTSPTLFRSAREVNAADSDLVKRVFNFLLTKQMRGPLLIESVGGVVTLSGQVGSFYHKQLLVHGAQRVAGVMRVDDRLEVAAWKK